MMRTLERASQTFLLPGRSKWEGGKNLYTSPGSRTVNKFPKNGRLFASTVPKSELLKNAENQIKSMQMRQMSQFPDPLLPPVPEKIEIMKITQNDPWSPIVLVFGWAGANHKNLQKYCQIYQNLGCSTAAFTLPAEYVLNNTEMVPRLFVEQQVIKKLKKLNIENRDVIVHVMSDAGTMMYQAMMSTALGKLMKYNWMDGDAGFGIRAVVWDSACGPYPEITAPRLSVFMLIARHLYKNEGKTELEALRLCATLMKNRGFPGLYARWRGEKMNLSLINDTWSGHWGRDHHKRYPDVPEMFLYSNKDFYLKDTYLEQTALAQREAKGSAFTAFKFKDSAHVMHLKEDPDMYKKKIKEIVEANTRAEERETPHTEQQSEEKIPKKEQKLPLNRKIGRAILKFFGY